MKLVGVPSADYETERLENNRFVALFGMKVPRTGWGDWFKCWGIGGHTRAFSEQEIANILVKSAYAKSLEEGLGIVPEITSREYRLYGHDNPAARFKQYQDKEGEVGFKLHYISNDSGFVGRCEC